MNISSLNIVVDVASLERSSHGQVTGIIYVEINGTPFPERQWSDSVVIVLSMWIASLNELILGASNTASLRFMDGPFRLEMKRDSNEECLYAVDSRRSRPIISNVECDFGRIRASTLRAALEILSECSQRIWWSPDIDHLMSLTRNVPE